MQMYITALTKRNAMPYLGILGQNFIVPLGDQVVCSVKRNKFFGSLDEQFVRLS